MPCVNFLGNNLRSCRVAPERLVAPAAFRDSGTANLPTNIVDFSGFDSSIMLICKGWNSQAHREFPGKFESSNVSRGNVSREIGRSFRNALSLAAGHSGVPCATKYDMIC